MKKEPKLKKRLGLNERTSDGETMILDRTNGQIHHLNSTASQIWQQCEGSSAKTIAGTLAQTFQIDRTKAEKDVASLLGKMRAMGLLEVVKNETD